MTAAREWATTASIGSYLVLYATGESEEANSLCGFTDAQLDTLDRILSTSGLTLQANHLGWQAVGN